jgi:uncharacterized SAM-binding protein YcdF (DUF218 family)
VNLPIKTPGMTKAQPVGTRPARPWLRWGFGFVLIAIGLLGCVLRWGDRLLIADDPVPVRADAAVVMQGSIIGENVRIAGAVQLLQQGTVGSMLISVPKESYWGQAVSPIARNHIEKKYGHEIASRTDFCESTSEVDSTGQEAAVLIGCIRERGWNSVILVTSNFHTRRAGMIWRRMLRAQNSTIRLYVHAVDDPEFRAAGWWRDRRSAKTWLTELTKLFWAVGESH